MDAVPRGIDQAAVRDWLHAQPGVAAVHHLHIWSLGAGEVALPLRFVAQFAAAVPLLILMVGPFYLRCLRRGVDHVVERSFRLIHPEEETSC